MNRWWENGTVCDRPFPESLYEEANGYEVIYEYDCVPLVWRSGPFLGWQMDEDLTPGQRADIYVVVELEPEVMQGLLDNTLPCRKVLLSGKRTWAVATGWVDSPNVWRQIDPALIPDDSLPIGDVKLSLD